MKIELEQNSDAWHEFRKSGIGASEIAAAIGKSPYQTPYGLWTIKTGRVEQEVNAFMRRGSELEPKARKAYEEYTGLTMSPEVHRHDKHDYLFASLDGVNHESDLLLEIKVPGTRKTIDNVKEGIVPESYVYQIQQQLMCSGKSKAHLWVWDDDAGEGHLIPYEPVHTKVEEIHTGGAEFWSHIISDKPPKAKKSDMVIIEGNEMLSALVEKYREVMDQFRETKEEKADLESQIRALMDGHAKIYCDGLKVTEYSRQGSVDYSKIAVLQGIDLARYRKRPTQGVKFTLGEKLLIRQGKAPNK